MAQLTDGTKIDCTSELPGGIHVIKDGEIHGYKYFRNCKIQESWMDWLTGTYRVSALCWAKVSVGKDDTLVRPQKREYEDPYSYYDVKSDDLRSDKLHVDQLETQCGKKCVSATSPFRKTEYLSHSDNTCDKLSRNLEEDCVHGLHFYPTLEILKRAIYKEYTVTRYRGDKVMYSVHRTAY